MKGRQLVVTVAAGATVVLTAGTGLAIAGSQAPSMPPGATRAQPVQSLSGMPGMMISSEADYLRHMVPHHEEAVAAARQLARSERPELRRFGKEVVATQTREISQMKAWLRQWYPGQSQRAPYRPMMRNLSSLRGNALDRAFLEDMIPHHMHAVMMSQQLLRHGLVRHSAIVPFAERIRDTQHDEIRQMRQWLARWFGARAGHGPGAGRGPGPGARGPGPGSGPGPGGGWRHGHGTGCIGTARSA